MKTDWEENELLRLVRTCVAGELPPDSPEPGAEVDLVKSGALDSMGWVGVLSGLEKALAVRDFGGTWPAELPQSIEALVEMARKAISTTTHEAPSTRQSQPSGSPSSICIDGWGKALGSLRIESTDVELKLGLPAGTLGERAGIHSVRKAAESEDELSLGHAAATQAMELADCDLSEIDFLICTSATFLEIPTFAAALHNRLLLPESCATLDIGGACLGLVNGLATAKTFLANGKSAAALVVASEVHSRRLCLSPESGEFRGLFGDGACAFVLNAGDTRASGRSRFQIGDFISGCCGALAPGLRVILQANGMTEIDFRGEALGKAAVAALHDVIAKLENLSGTPQSDIVGYALHEPNPRLIAILAKRANLPADKLFLTAEQTGNLGSVMCGVNLCSALTSARTNTHQNTHGTIILAAVAPGLLWSGMYLIRQSTTK